MFPLLNSSVRATKWLVLLSVCLAAAAMPLTFTGTAVATPALAHALGGSPVAIAWVTNAFMLTFGSTLMTAGALADSYGRKKVFLTGIGLFAVFSLGLVFAPNILVFDLLRAAQGFSAAAAFSGGMAALAQEFTDTARLRAFSFVGTSFGAGLSLGPVASGLMIEAFGWRSIFLLVLAFAIIAFLLGQSALRESRDPTSKGFDWFGALSFTAALGFFTYGILLAPERGWGASSVIGLLMSATLFLILFVTIEHRVSRPMLDLSLFAYPRFVSVQLLAAAPAYSFVVLLILLPMRFIGIEGMNEISAGTLMMALTAPLLILPIGAGLLTRWFRPATICGTGLLVTASGLLWLSQTPVGAAASITALPMLTIGIGMSLPWGLMDGLAVSVVPKDRAGMATGIFSTTRVAGEGIALAVVSAIFSTLLAAGIGKAHLTGNIPSAAQRLASGDIITAIASLPGTQKADLIILYANSFHELLLLLATITLVTALIIFLFLRVSDRT
jgi:MFS family permease